MDFEFYPVRTQDGSLGLYSDVVDDIYHSSYGAIDESLKKFIIPSGLLDFAKSKSELRLLDICFGLGYNTKCALSEILKVNPSISFHSTCLELDSDVLAFSILMDHPSLEEKNLLYLFDELLNNGTVQKSFIRILFNESYFEFFNENSKKFLSYIESLGISCLEDALKCSDLHNIYYQYISGRNIEKQEISQKHQNTGFLLCLGDARKAVLQLQGKYDFIFLDAFTPLKLPTLWSVEFFKELYRLLSDNGNITTYSNSAAVRSAMIEAGFFVGKTDYGTIAYKNESLVEDVLDEKSLGLLNTNAGIPFCDKGLNSSPEDILQLRQDMISSSNRVSSSSFLKDFKKRSQGV